VSNRGDRATVGMLTVLPEESPQCEPSSAITAHIFGDPREYLVGTLTAPGRVQGSHGTTDVTILRSAESLTWREAKERLVAWIRGGWRRRVRPHTT
jgi:hypothetical protein